MNNKKLKNLIKNIIKETFQSLNEINLRGEWWIYPGGHVEFADGDLGDSNHESVVISYLVSEILEYFNIPYENGGLLDQYEDTIKKILKHKFKLSSEELEQYDDSPSEYILKTLIKDRVYKDQKQAEDAVYIAYGSTSRDARDYGMHYLKWKRLDFRGVYVYVQSWTLTTSDLSDIIKGINNAIDDVDTYSEESMDDIKINIEIRSNNKQYTNISYNDLSNSDVINKLHNYKSSINPHINEAFHQNKEWMMYEAENKIITLFGDNSRLTLEINYKNNRGDDKEKWKHKAASKWKSLARELYNNVELSEVGNPIQKSWKTCFEESLQNEELKPFIKKNVTPVF